MKIGIMSLLTFEIFARIGSKMQQLGETGRAGVLDDSNLGLRIKKYCSFICESDQFFSKASYS